MQLAWSGLLRAGGGWSNSRTAHMPCDVADKPTYLALWKAGISASRLGFGGPPAHSTADWLMQLLMLSHQSGHKLMVVQDEHGGLSPCASSSSSSRAFS